MGKNGFVKKLIQKFYRFLWIGTYFFLQVLKMPELVIIQENYFASAEVVRQPKIPYLPLFWYKRNEKHRISHFLLNKGRQGRKDLVKNGPITNVVRCCNLVGSE